MIMIFLKKGRHKSIYTDKLTEVAVHSHPTKLPMHLATPLASNPPAQPFRSQS
jgi:hypothetical protein